MSIQAVYLLAVIFTAALLGGLGFSAARMRHDRSAAPFVFVCGAAVLWLVLIGAMAVSPPPLARVLLSLKYLAIGATPVSAFVFMMTWLGRTSWWQPRRIAALMVVPLIGHLASWRDGGEMLRAVHFAQLDGLTYIDHIEFGSIYWLFTAYGYMLSLASVVQGVSRALGAGRTLRRQGLLITLGTLAPIASNMVLISGIAPRPFDTMVLGLGINGVALWWAIYRAHLFDLAPVARAVLVDALADGILILDSQGRAIDVNHAFTTLAGVTANEVLGRRVDALALSHDKLAHAIRDAALATTVGGPPASIELASHVYEIATLPIAGGAGRSQGRILVFRDVTARHAWAAEQSRLIDELQAALGQVRTLTGLLPICAGCKQIRDGQGHWQHLEVYIRERTNADFTHGICPDCMTRLYPDL